MSDRLKELQHQRGLVLEQLAWLDREIAAFRGTAGTDVAPVPFERLPTAPPMKVNPARHLQDEIAANIAAEEIMAQYQKEGHSVHSRVKRGCFLYFFIALALLSLGVFALYLFRTRR